MYMLLEGYGVICESIHNRTNSFSKMEVNSFIKFIFWKSISENIYIFRIHKNYYLRIKKIFFLWFLFVFYLFVLESLRFDY